MSLARQARIFTSLALAGVAAGVVATSVALLAGCSGKTIGADLNQNVDPTTPADAGPDVAPCTAIATACNPGDQPVPQESCARVESCYALPSVCGEPPVWCLRPTVQCGAIPRCDVGDTEVNVCPPPVPGPGPKGGGGYECYTRSLCGSTITCEHTDACNVAPVCNPGDIQVANGNACSSCYSVTSCNMTIECYSPVPPPPPPPKPQPKPADSP